MNRDYRDYIEERAKNIGEIIVNTKQTMRQVAVIIGVSKSTVEKDIKKLEYIDGALYEKVREVTEANKAERHIRGGEATKALYRG